MAPMLFLLLNAEADKGRRSDRTAFMVLFMFEVQTFYQRSIWLPETVLGCKKHAINPMVAKPENNSIRD